MKLLPGVAAVAWWLICHAALVAQDHAEPQWKLVRPSTPEGITMTTYVLAKYPEHTVEVITYVPEGPGPFFIEGEKDRVKLGRPEMMEKLKA